MNKLIYFQNGLSMGLFIVGSLFLFLRAEKKRERTILSAALLVWAIDYSLRLANSLFNGIPIVRNVFFTPIHLIEGAFLIQVLVPYVIEVVRPGWVNGKRLFYIVLPCIGLSVFYYGMLWLLKEPVVKLRGFDDLAVYLGQFNVWFRFILAAMVFGYLFLLYRISMSCRFCYVSRHNDNEASVKWIDRFWPCCFTSGILCVTLTFCFTLFKSDRIWDSIFQMVIDFVFICTCYKELFYENARRVVCLACEDGNMQQHKNEKNFTDSLPGYIRIVEAWMQNAQPYLRKDLKLMDVTDILSLNRTYLSRVFNEGFGCPFIQYIQNYRIEKAKELLLDQPSFTIKDVANACGFTSVSTFHTAFVKKTGLPPSLFRKQELRN